MKIWIAEVLIGSLVEGTWWEHRVVQRKFYTEHSGREIPILKDILKCCMVPKFGV